MKLERGGEETEGGTGGDRLREGGEKRRREREAGEETRRGEEREEGLYSCKRPTNNNYMMPTTRTF